MQVMKTSRHLIESMENLLKLREKEGRWIDSENTEGVLKNLEALSCFLSSSFYLEDIQLIDSRFYIPKLDEKILESDIESIINHIDKKGFSSSPYLDREFKKFGIEYQKGKTDFTDTVAFFITTILDLYTYYDKVYKKEFKNEKIKTYLNEAIDWLVENAFEKEAVKKKSNGEAYWSWGSKDCCINIPSLYFTWSASVSLSYCLRSDYLPISDKQKDKITILLNKVANWLSNILKEDSEFKGKRWEIDYDGYEDTISERPEAPLIYFCNIINWLNTAGIHVENTIIENVLKTMIDIYNTKQLWRFDIDSHTIILPENLTKTGKEERIKYEDRAYKYLLLTAITWLYKISRENLIKTTEEERELLKKFIDILITDIMKEMDDNLKLWVAGGFLIYMTQRALEGLISYMNA